MAKDNNNMVENQTNEEAAKKPGCAIAVWTFLFLLYCLLVPGIIDFLYIFSLVEPPDILYIFCISFGLTIYLLLIFLLLHIRVCAIICAIAALLMFVCTKPATDYFYQKEHAEKIAASKTADSIRNPIFKQYEPFASNTITAQLPEKAKFQIKDDFPSMDCALALYPIVASFVSAVYDESVENFQRRGYDFWVYKYSPSDRAYTNLISGKTDILLAAKPSKTQSEMALDQGVELALTPIGKEAFVFFVNAGNPVDNLTTEQLKAIYSGKIANWQEVGGKNENIRAFQRNAGSGSQTALEHFMGDTPLMEVKEKERVVNDMSYMITAANYRNYPNALGFSFRFFVNELVDNSEVKLLKIDGVYPDKDTIRDGSYPLSSEFYAVTNINRKPVEDEFIQWMLSPQGQYLIEASGYVAIGNAELD